ncbi:hypothetical protein ANN_09198 [Periplaneta americana]|uniref:Reverse transcriptase domain-containing protein n=1 Tax=Periplaneta americana TaxID=6978 RepID=A0ABQ8TMR6_PERAM|nr:hypothetical protein ANN_09198 [Periplaneta americana]
MKCIRFSEGMELSEEDMILRDMLLELNDSREQYEMKINANKTNNVVIERKIKKIFPSPLCPRVVIDRIFVIMGWTRGQATRRQMDIPSYHVGPPYRKETSGQTSAQMGSLLQRTGRSTMVQRGKRQKKVETTRETFVHRQEVVKGSERIIVKEIQVLRFKYHV